MQENEMQNVTGILMVGSNGANSASLPAAR